MRDQELQEMLEQAEEDDLLKVDQALKAIGTLRVYENSEDGLADALKEIRKLQEKVHQWKKEIHELVAELNGQNELVTRRSTNFKITSIRRNATSSENRGNRLKSENCAYQIAAWRTNDDDRISIIS